MPCPSNHTISDRYLNKEISTLGQTCCLPGKIFHTVAQAKHDKSLKNIAFKADGWKTWKKKTHSQQ